MSYSYNSLARCWYSSKIELDNELHQCLCTASRWLVSLLLTVHLGMMHRVSPVRIIRDRFNDSPELARRTHPAPSSSPWTSCCWWWPGAAGGETEKLLGCWESLPPAATMKPFVVWVVFPPPLPLGICLNLVGFLSGTLACQPKQSCVPATVNITRDLLFFFLSSRRSVYS